MNHSKIHSLNHMFILHIIPPGPYRIHGIILKHGQFHYVYLGLTYSYADHLHKNILHQEYILYHLNL